MRLRSLKLWSVVLFFGLYVFSYIVPGFFPISQPNFLHLTGWETRIPLVSWTFLIYLSDYLLGFTVFLLIQDPSEYRSFLIRMFGTLALCGVCFWIYPTTYPRPFYEPEGFLPVKIAMWLVRNLDSPGNCLPSQHVALTWISFACLPDKNRNLRIGFFLWSLAICVSTLTTKQHYLTDIAAGTAVALVMVLAERRISSKIGKNVVMVAHASESYRTGTYR